MNNKSKRDFKRAMRIALFSILLFTIPNFVIAQVRKAITGSVIDDQTKKPLAGVSVKLKGSDKGVVTSSVGTYSISAGAKDILVFSYLGYEASEFLVGRRTTINVSLKSNARLSEVVQIGYGAIYKSELVGSVGQVYVPELAQAPVGNFSDAMAGRIAGVQVSSETGQPGNAASILIRGANSLTSDNSPLYVVDGTPIEHFNVNALNPEEIQSINILKDASSTAIYGSRGANGVIIVDTKRGKVSAPVVTFNTSVGFQNGPEQIAMMDPSEFVRYQADLNLDAARALYAPAEFPNSDPRYNAGGRNFNSYKNLSGSDWQSLISASNAPIQIHDIALRGGTEQTQYSFSGSLFNQQGIITNSDVKRYQGRVVVDQLVSKKIKIGITGNYSINAKNGQAIGAGEGNDFSSYALYRAWGFRPLSGDGTNLENLTVDPSHSTTGDIRVNPLISTENSYKYNKEKTFHTSAYFNFDILKNLVFRSTGSFYSNNGRLDQFYNSSTAEGNPIRNPLTGVNGSFLFMKDSDLSTENTLSYNATYKGYHKFGLMGGVSYQKSSNNIIGYSVDRIPMEQLGMYGLDEGVPTLDGGKSGGRQHSFLSFYGRMNYNYKSRYFLTATFRADDASIFDKKNEVWSYSPSVGLAWNLKNENFLKDFDLLSTSKIRGSYGISGNNTPELFGQNSYLAYAFANATINPTGNVAIGTLYNPALRWESTEQLDIGYDLGLLKNRIALSFDYYKKTTGFLKSYTNIGSVRNTGLEFALNTVNLQTKSFKWISSFNISFNKNRVLSLANDMENIYSSMVDGSLANPLYVSKVGSPIGMFYGYTFNGIYQEEDFDNPAPGQYVLKDGISDNGNLRAVIQPGDIKYKDLDFNGTIDENDKSIIGRSLPKHIGGFSNSLSYKNFDLNVLFQWSYGNDIYNANRIVFEGNPLNTFNVNQFASYAHRWTPQNRSNELYRVGGQGPSGFQSDRVLEDGSYLRLKTVVFGYTIPKKNTKSRLSNLRLQVAAQNLLTFTDYSGLDPESSARNSVLTPSFDYSVYPQARTISFGINASF